MNYKKRITLLQKKLRRKKHDALLVSQPENRRYLSGYTVQDHGIGESAGSLLIPARGKPYLLSDFRFREQAENEAKEYQVILYPKGLLTLLESLLADHTIKKLAFESDYMLYSTAINMKKRGKKCGFELVPTINLVERMRLIKSKRELELIRESVALNERVFQTVYRSLTPGISETEIALQILSEMRTQGSEGESFETIAAIGTASSLPHAVPGEKTLAKNDTLLIDMGLVLEGYCSDMTRTVCLGKASKRFRKIHRVVREAQLAGIAAVKEGVTGKEVDRAARQVIADAGYGKYFGHALGHGVGLAVHESPRISKKGSQKLKENMVITIEPGIYIPGWGGIRLENMVIVKKDSCENLNSDTTWLDI